MISQPLPELPAIARKPLAWLPMPVKAMAITRTMNFVFATPLAAGDLKFLDERVLNVFIVDAGLRFSVWHERNKLRVGAEAADADVTIEGTIYTFLLLATREEDADTLFFRRQLKTSGDTELGLYIKNFLDGLDPESLPLHTIMDHILRSSVSVAERFAMLQSGK